MKTINKITAVFLAAIFLFFSLGFTIGSMVCSKSGEEKLALTVMEDCCSTAIACCDDEHEEKISASNITTIQKSDCCDINNITLKLNEFKSVQQINLEQAAIVLSLFYQPFTFTIENTSLAINKEQCDLSPTLHGRQLLSFISTLII